MASFVAKRTEKDGILVRAKDRGPMIDSPLPRSREPANHQERRQLVSQGRHVARKEETTEARNGMMVDPEKQRRSEETNQARG